MLAGISSDYYLRLEQGRDNHPSIEVIDAIARALRLDADATAYLHSLSRPSARPRPQEPEVAPDSIVGLIDSWPRTPAFVHGPYLDVLAANALATALSPAFRPGVNLVRATFLDPDIRTLFGDWPDIALRSVARLRALAGPEVDDPRLAELVGELSVRSDAFRQLWARHDVEAAGVPGYTLNHPVVGMFEVRVERLAIVGADGQILVFHHADPGSPSETALIRLADRTSPTERSGRT